MEKPLTFVPKLTCKTISCNIFANIAMQLASDGLSCFVIHTTTAARRPTKTKRNGDLKRKMVFLFDVLIRSSHLQSGTLLR